jgi:hypothetical protein
LFTRLFLGVGKIVNAVFRHHTRGLLGNELPKLILVFARHVLKSVKKLKT